MDPASSVESLDGETGPLVLVSSIQRHTRVLCLNRPQKRNALSQALIKSLLRGLSTADEDEDVRVIIITGAGLSFSGMCCKLYVF
jgi:enoyl-CoA hydratase/carnithine racemase